MFHYNKSGVPDTQNGIERENVGTDVYSRCRFAYVGTWWKHYLNITLSQRFMKGVENQEVNPDVWV